MTLRVPFAMARAESPLLSGKGIASQDWYRFFVSLYNAVTQGMTQPTEAVTVGASPFTYQAVIRSQVFIVGGTVSAAEYSRDGVSYYPVSSPVQMAQNDFLRVTYSVAPAMVAVPL